MIGNIRTVCLFVLCLVNVFAGIQTAEAKVKDDKAVERPKSKIAAKHPPGKERGLKKQAIKRLERKSGLAQTRHKQSVKSRRASIPGRGVKKHQVKKPMVKLALVPPRQKSIKPPRVPVTDRVSLFEIPEEILTAELTDDTLPLEEAAFSLIGTRYQFGGSSTRGIDCSAFVQRVYSFLKIPIPRTAREQFGIGTEITQGEVQKGDLLFFQTYARFPSHVAIYLGDNRMIHASSGSRRVIISNMDTPYYRSRYLGARRLPGVEGDPLPQLLASL